MPRSRRVDGFELAYDDSSGERPVLLLHGWPGDRTDFRRVLPLLPVDARVVVPDLRGFGRSDKYAEPPSNAYSPAAQARSVLGLMDELGIQSAVLAGYDIGSRIAQTVARNAPDRCAHSSSPRHCRASASASSPPRPSENSGTRPSINSG
jgi:pimeloyl-ACP methyl ester carboxylesterase